MRWKLLQEHWRRVLPVTEQELPIVQGLFDGFESKFQLLDEQQKTQLAQDLHPLGRFCVAHMMIWEKRRAVLYSEP